MAKKETRPVIISAQDMHVQIADLTVLKSAMLTLHEGEKVAVVGRNGVGKSTFFRVLAGEDDATSGEIIRRKNLISYYLPQEVKLEDKLTVYENIYHGAGYIVELIKRFEALPADSNESLALEGKINALDGWDLENRIKVVMDSLNVPAPDRIVGELSGGEKRRVALSRAIVGQPELLLLDEPTNHLDTESIGWLSEFLNRYKGTCLMVTHDRFFLDTIATRIVEIANGELYSFDGNYADYLIGKAKRQEVTEQNEKRRKSFIRNEIDWIRRGPKARGTKSRSRIDRFYDAVDQGPPEQEENAEVIIPKAPKLGKRIVEIKNLSMSRGGKELYKDFSFNFETGAKIGIVGRNGIGKTSFIMNLLGELQPDSGEVRVGELTEINYVDQHRIQLSEDKTVKEDISEGQEFVQLGEQRLNVWAYLKRFLFSDDRINTLVSQLSGGERNRLLLAKILKHGGNFLILDEPTNDLDLPTLGILEEALLSFAGCVLVVSHDRYFLNRICSGILAFEGDGKIAYQEGDYDYYSEKLAERKAAKFAENRKIKKTISSTPKPKKRKKITWKDEQELEGMEEKIMEAEEKIEKLEATFAEPNFFAKHGENSNQLTQDLADAKQHATTLYDRWTVLEELAENN